MPAYYNEFDPHAAEWLRNLIDAGLIAPGDVDERSITEVRGDDLGDYEQIHFFAGIGGWSLALRLAGWPDDVPVWTGSCPCQPFSAAGKRKGIADERHLWPEMFRLIAECRPATIIGEQVAAAIKHGWLDGVFDDLEGLDYACGAVDLPACSVGAPHIRQRIFWLADSNGGSRVESHGHTIERGRSDDAEQIGMGGGSSGLRHANGERQDSQRGISAGPGIDGEGSVRRLSDAAEPGRQGSIRESHEGRTGPDIRRGLCDAILTRLEGHSGDGDDGNQSGQVGANKDGSVATSGGWNDFELVHCRDGKTRRLESGLEPLVDGVAFRLADGRSRADCSRAAILKGIGNAIEHHVAAEFIKAVRGDS